MNRHANTIVHLAALILTILAFRRTSAQPPSAALATFNTYIAAQEARLTSQHQSDESFLAPLTPAQHTSLLHGEILTEQLTPTTPMPGALLHHWRATAFAPNATAAQLELLLRDFNHYPQLFAPQVLRATAIPRPNNHLQATLRVRQKHVLTVVLDSTYDVTFTALTPQDRSSASRSTRIYEIDSPNTPQEHPLSDREEHGFLWRQNTYWTWQQRPDGLSIQLESISLSRSIPTGLGWAVRPFLQSVPRDSLEFTLHSALNALHN